MQRNTLLVASIACCLPILAFSCNRPPADTRAADEAAIRQTDLAWSKTAEAKQIEDFMAFSVDDQLLLAPNGPMITGKEGVRKMFAGMFAAPGFTIKWQPSKVEAAVSGDLGYSIGTYELSMNDPQGNPVVDKGKYATVWKKQADGKWKVAVDMFNSDIPLPPPPKQEGKHHAGA